MEPAGTELSYETRRTLAAIVDALTTDIGRLNRRAEDGSTLAHLAERLATQLELLDAIVQPTAHQIYLANYCAAGNHQLALEEALRVVDARVHSLRARLGLDTDGHRKTSQPPVLVQAAAA